MSNPSVVFVGGIMHASGDSLPVDSDVPPDDPGLHRRLGETFAGRWDILAVISVGGALGSLCRWGLAEALPHQPGSIAWSTVTANVSGAFALGVLMVLAVDAWPRSRYLRPLVGVGLLGGYTTFSTAMLDLRSLFAEGEALRAAGYVSVTLVPGLLAVWLGLAVMRALASRLSRQGSGLGPAGDRGQQ
jgi:CrcB protein